MGGLGNVVNAFGRMGIPMPGISGPFIAFLELLGGLALLVGLFSRWLGLIFARGANGEMLEMRRGIGGSRLGPHVGR